MYFKKIDEDRAVDFTRRLLDHYKKEDNGCVDKILTYQDIESNRNNVGWYQHVDDEHRLFINVPNVLCAEGAVEQGIIDYDAFYAFLALCTGHEFRHFRQGRVIYEGQEIDGYTQEDVLNSELMLYIRYFFDAYYLLNKGNVKYELDAEKFAIVNGVAYLKHNFPSINAEKAMLDAVNFYANIQVRGGVIPTLPLGCTSLEQVIQELQRRITLNERIKELDQTLFVHNPRFYQTHELFGLNEDEVLNDELIQSYYNEASGSKRDLLVVKRILSLLKRPEESLGDFPKLSKTYKEKTL